MGDKLMGTPGRSRYSRSPGSPYSPLSGGDDGDGSSDEDIGHSPYHPGLGSSASSGDAVQAIKPDAAMPPAMRTKIGRRATGQERIVGAEIVKCKAKLALALFRLQQAQSASASTSTSSHQALAVNASLPAEVKRLTDRLQRLMSTSEPEQLLAAAHSLHTVEARNDYLEAWNDHQSYYKTTWPGWALKHAFNLAAGASAYGLCFMPGALVAALTGSPWAATATSTVAWTAFEPLFIMIRATTWTSPELEAYVERQRMTARAWREWAEGSAAAEGNRKYQWKDQHGNIHWLNAADSLKHGKGSWLMLWQGKLMTDDVPYCLYSIANTGRNLVPEAIGMPGLYQSFWPNFLSRACSGMAAGALAMEVVQLSRQWKAGGDAKRETVTKSMHIWKLEAVYLRCLLADIDRRMGEPGADDPASQGLQELRDVVGAWHAKAVAKSWLGTSIRYEWKAMWQVKRVAIGVDTETPGKRLDSVASFISKFSCQAFGAVATGFGQQAAKSSLPWMRMLGHVVPPLAQILPPFGVMTRRELEAGARAALGAMQGWYRKAACCRAKAHED